MVVIGIKLSAVTRSSKILAMGILVMPSPAVHGATSAQDEWSGAPADVFAELGDNVGRIWRFENATQRWTFYDPRPVLRDHSTLKTISRGDIVWLLVDDPQQFRGHALHAGWNVIAMAPVPSNRSSASAATVFADLTASGNLEQVWRFDNASQSWSLYHPDFPAEENSLSTIHNGDIVYLEVESQRQFQGQTLYAGWNLIAVTVESGG